MIKIENGHVYETITQPSGSKVTVPKTLARHLYANFDNGVVGVSLRDWEGKTLAENITVTILVSDQPAGQLDLTAGQGSFDFDAFTGTYKIRIEAYMCESAELEVLVSG